MKEIISKNILTIYDIKLYRNHVQSGESSKIISLCYVEMRFICDKIRLKLTCYWNGLQK